MKPPHNPSPMMAFIVGCIFFISVFFVSSTAHPAAPGSMGVNLRDNTGPLPGWSFVGCYTDRKSSSRTLLQKNFVHANMTPAMCLSFCQGNGTDDSPLTGYNFAGLEWSTECYCDYNIEGTAKKVDDVVCSFPCGGDPSFTCGAAGIISIYQDLGHGGVLPTNKATYGAWTYEGCHTDAVDGNERTLDRRVDIPSGVTIESCTAQCANEGFGIAGLEYGQECWCGSTFLVANTTTARTECSQACKADHTELCGAANRLSVYLFG